MSQRSLFIICICIISLAVIFVERSDFSEQGSPQLGSKENPTTLPCNQKIHAIGRDRYLLRGMREGEFPETYSFVYSENRDLNAVDQRGYVREQKCDTN